MTTRRVFLSGLLGGLLSLSALVPPGAGAQTSKKDLRIGYQKSATVLAAAKQQKLFEKALAPLGIQSVQWIEFQYGPPLLEALGSGAIDLGQVGDTPPVFAQSAGAGILYLATCAQQESAVLVPDSSDIKKAEQLKGKKIAVARGSSAHNLMVVVLEKYGLQFDDITPVYLAPSDAVAALITKRVDAWAVWDPYAALAVKNHHARPLVSTIRDGIESDSFYIINARFAKETPELVKAIYDTLSEATHWTDRNRDDVARLISGLTGVEYMVQRGVLERTVFNLSTISAAVVKRQQQVADRFFRLGLIASPVQISDIIWHHG